MTSTGLVVIGNLDGYVYAIDGKTGEFKWRFATDGAKQGLGVTSSVAEYEGKLIFGANDGNIYGIKLDDQSVAWKVKTGDEINSSPVLDDKGILYCGSRDKNLYAIDAKTGEQNGARRCKDRFWPFPPFTRTWCSSGLEKGTVMLTF